jgi:hypothetical protein
MDRRGGLQGKGGRTTGTDVWTGSDAIWSENVKGNHR